MAVLMTKAFARFARKARLAGASLAEAASAVAVGKFDADLGGHVYKQRIAREGGGKSGGFRTIIVFKAEHDTFFVHGFAKKAKANITAKEMKALKRLAEVYLGYSVGEIGAAIEDGALIEVTNNGCEED